MRSILNTLVSHSCVREVVDVALKQSKFSIFHHDPRRRRCRTENWNKPKHVSVSWNRTPRPIALSEGPSIRSAQNAGTAVGANAAGVPVRCLSVFANIRKRRITGSITYHAPLFIDCLKIEFLSNDTIRAMSRPATSSGRSPALR